MKLANFSQASLLVSERRQLETKLISKIGVTLAGTYQDDDIVELVRPVVEAEIRARISRIDAELRLLGVEVAG